MTTIQLELPDTMAESIRQKGLLNQNGLRQMLREALRSQAIDFFREYAAEGKRMGLVAMSEEEIQAEIDAARAAEKRG